MNRSRSSFLAVLAVLISIRPGLAQSTSYVVDARRSMAWWQLDPHFGHLWATTCPDDRSWQPGEGHSSGFYVNYKTRPKISTLKKNESRIPLFPRDTVRANCRRAVTGTVTASADGRFSQIKGRIAVRADSITIGATERDFFANKYVYNSAKYPEIGFTIDSLTSVTISGDSVNAIAVGTFDLRGFPKATRVQVRGVQTADGLRVRGMFAMPASELQHRYSVSKIALGMGVGLGMWDTLFMGFDVILVPRT